MKYKDRKVEICINCGNKDHIIAKSMCNNCYKKVGTPKIICIKCKKLKNHHSKEMCANCYNKSNEKGYNKVKANNYLKWHNISLELYNEKTKKCLICDFDKAVELHHLDKDHKNNNSSNLIGLCPNHHKMLHMDKYNKEIQKLIDKRLNSEEIT